MKNILSLLMVLPLVGALTGCCCLGGGSGCNSCGTSYYGPSYSSGGCSTGNCGVTQTYPSGAMSYPQMSAMPGPATAMAPQTYATASAPLESLPTY
ncbi:MAG: hypothetical protein R3C11_18350 [Planctomycetaceae bacterium]